MDYVFVAEQEALRSTLRALLTQHADEAAVRATMESESGYDETLWHRLANEVGLHGLAIPTEYGGAGGSFVDLAVALEEFGRTLYCGPFFASVVLAAHALKYSGDEGASLKYLPSIASGEVIATVAATELLTMENREERPRADSSGAGTWITGAAGYVMDGHLADIFIVAADDEAGGSLYLVEKGANGTTAHQLPTMDRTRRFASVTFDNTPAIRLGAGGNVQTVLDRVRDLAIVALAVEQVGGAQMMLDTAVDYAKIRSQFGRAIGSFQAIKHRCADMSVELEGARSAAYNAVWIVYAEGRREHEGLAASIAHSYCSEAFMRATASNIQIHGGIGFTWEHRAHLYYKRAKSSEMLFGSPAVHRRRLARLLSLAPFSAVMTSSSGTRQ